MICLLLGVFFCFCFCFTFTLVCDLSASCIWGFVVCHIFGRKLKIMSAITSSNTSSVSFLLCFLYAHGTVCNYFTASEYSVAFLILFHFSFQYESFCWPVFKLSESQLCPVYWWNHQRHFSFMSLELQFDSFLRVFLSLLT